jgi:predicted nuclease of predicted toxin-antitoxin system
MKFLTDMGISRTTVSWLKEKGFDALHVRDIGMHRASDTEIVLKAKEESRMVLTCDLDFGDIMAA